MKSWTTPSPIFGDSCSWLTVTFPPTLLLSPASSFTFAHSSHLLDSPFLCVCSLTRRSHTLMTPKICLQLIYTTASLTFLLNVSKFICSKLNLFSPAPKSTLFYCLPHVDRDFILCTAVSLMPIM